MTQKDKPKCTLYKEFATHGLDAEFPRLAHGFLQLEDSQDIAVLANELAEKLGTEYKAKATVAPFLMCKKDSYGNDNPFPPLGDLYLIMTDKGPEVVGSILDYGKVADIAIKTNSEFNALQFLRTFVDDKFTITDNNFRSEEPKHYESVTCR